MTATKVRTSSVTTKRTKNTAAVEKISVDPAYPYTYAADLIRKLPDPAWGKTAQLGDFLRRPSAIAVVRLVARVMQVNARDVAEALADEYLRTQTMS